MTLEKRSEQSCFGGSVGFYSHQSLVCDGPMRFAVFVPPQAHTAPVPVVYYLSGLTCTEENFTSKAGAQRVAAELGLMLVAPDTSPRERGLAGEEDDWDFGTGAGFYVDATERPWSRYYQMYQYVARELPALVDQQFPSRGPEYRSIFGHSMGGHGALVIGLRNPAGYRSISAFAPICAPSSCPWGQKAFAGYLGEDRDAWHAYDATQLVARQQHPTTILIDQGGEDPFLAEQLHPESFERACEAAGQSLTLRRQAGYDHSYYFIATFVEDHLRHHARHLL